MEKEHFFKHFKSDFSASIIVFFVALPLCLGIALASGAPLFSGIIAGIVGGIVVGFASGSSLGVAGPAAGLAVIILNSIASLGSYQAFLLAGVIAGVIQVILGFMRAGFIAYFFPSSVIKGMLTGIGLLIIMKQIPHLLGAHEGLSHTPGALLIGVVSIAVLVFWDMVLLKKHKIFQIIQGPIVVVVLGILLNILYTKGILGFSLLDNQLVRIPVPENLTGFLSQFTYPDFSQLYNFEVYKIAILLAIIGSLETLLSVEATDKLDPEKRITPTNRELKAQGLGNFISCMIGGLPVTQVIVRSSANISFGGKTKLSAILHGFWLLISAITIGSYLNMIPLASLAAILIMVGFKLAKPTLFKKMYTLGSEQFVPFVATVAAILATDLLKGISVGLVVGIFYVLKHSYRNSHHLKEVIKSEDGRDVHHLVLAEEVSFFNKASVLKTLDAIPKGAKVIIDCSKSVSISYDVVELICNFRDAAKGKDIMVETVNFIEPVIL